METYFPCFKVLPVKIVAALDFARAAQNCGMWNKQREVVIKIMLT